MQYPVGKRNVITRRSSRGPKGSTSHLISWQSSRITLIYKENPPQNPKFSPQNPKFHPQNPEFTL